jgi:tetratricopeptide (TPR) repeat protein
MFASCVIAGSALAGTFDPPKANEDTQRTAMRLRDHLRMGRFAMATRHNDQHSSAPDAASARDQTGAVEPQAKVVALDEDAAVSLLDGTLRAANPSDDRVAGDLSAADLLADLCNRMPLTLRIAAALLRSQATLTVSELADELRAEIVRGGEQHTHDCRELAAPPLVAVLALACERLNEPVARLFRLLSVSPGPDVSTAAAAVLANRPTSEVLPVLEGLARRYLIESVAGRDERWRMDDLVRPYAQRLSDAHAEIDQRAQRLDQLLGYYVRTAAAAAEYLRALSGTNLRSKFTSRESALAWLDAERPNLTAATELAADTGRDRIAVSLPLLLAQYLAQRRRFSDLLATTTVSLIAARRLGDRDSEGDAVLNLGGALLETGRFEEAVAAYRDAGAIFRETGDRHAEGDALNNLGIGLAGMGRLDEALTAHQVSATVLRETGDRHGEGKALNNLGLALRAMGRLDEAVVAHQDAVAIFRDTSDKRREAMALNNLGRARQEAGLCTQAISKQPDLRP